MTAVRSGPRHAWTWLVGAVLLALLLASGCEDGDNGGDGAEPDEATAAATEPSPTETPGGPRPTPTPESANGEASEDQASAFNESLTLALEGNEIGSEAPEDLIAEWNIDVMPDGTGLPEGSGTAEMGAQIYAIECAACHGPNGEGGIGPRLVSEEPGAWEPGDPVTIGSWWPYATTVYDYIRRAMPFYEPGILSDEEVYALTAFLLAANEIIEPEQEMNQETLPQVEMPARDLFHQCWPDVCYDEYGRDGAADQDEGNSNDEGNADEEETPDEG